MMRWSIGLLQRVIFFGRLTDCMSSILCLTDLISLISKLQETVPAELQSRKASIPLMCLPVVNQFLLMAY